MKYLILLFLLFSTPLYAADNIWYREAFVKTTVIDGKLDLPFPIYAQEVYVNGIKSDLLSVQNDTVVYASVDVMIDHQTLHRNDWPLVEAFIGKITESEFYAQITQTEEEASVEENF